MSADPEVIQSPQPVVLADRSIEQISSYGRRPRQNAFSVAPSSVYSVPDLEAIDRLPRIASSDDVEQSLAVPRPVFSDGRSSVRIMTRRGKLLHANGETQQPPLRPDVDRRRHSEAQIGRSASSVSRTSAAGSHTTHAKGKKALTGLENDIVEDGKHRPPYDVTRDKIERIDNDLQLRTKQKINSHQNVHHQSSGTELDNGTLRSSCRGDPMVVGSQFSSDTQSEYSRNGCGLFRSLTTTAGRYCDPRKKPSSARRPEVRLMITGEPNQEAASFTDLRTITLNDAQKKFLNQIPPIMTLPRSSQSECQRQPRARKIRLTGGPDSDTDFGDFIDIACFASDEDRRNADGSLQRDTVQTSRHIDRHLSSRPRYAASETIDQKQSRTFPKDLTTPVNKHDVALRTSTQVPSDKGDEVSRPRGLGIQNMRSWPGVLELPRRPFDANSVIDHLALPEKPSACRRDKSNVRPGLPSQRSPASSRKPDQRSVIGRSTINAINQNVASDKSFEKAKASSSRDSPSRTKMLERPQLGRMSFESDNTQRRFFIDTFDRGDYTDWVSTERRKSEEAHSDRQRFEQGQYDNTEGQAEAAVMLSRLARLASP